MEKQRFGNVERQQLFRDYYAGRGLPDFQLQLFLREDRRRLAYVRPRESSNSFHVERIRVLVPYPPMRDIKADAHWSITIKVGA